MSAPGGGGGEGLRDWGDGAAALMAVGAAVGAGGGVGLLFGAGLVFVGRGATVVSVAAGEGVIVGRGAAVSVAEMAVTAVGGAGSSPCRWQAERRSVTPNKERRKSLRIRRFGDWRLEFG
jgi:hypothetical protein